METFKKEQLNLYANLGKLFYAIAASDGSVKIEEYNKLIEVIELEWHSIFKNEDAFKYAVIDTFKSLYAERANPQNCFDQFVDFQESHKNLLNETLKSLILSTANKIASSFASKNKSELILLGKLNIAFKKSK